jgi:hypothetical protein
LCAQGLAALAMARQTHGIKPTEEMYVQVIKRTV